MSTEQVGNIGHYSKRFLRNEKWVIFLLEPVVGLQLGPDASDEPNRFRFDREIALLLLLIWSMWPNDDASLGTACRLIADAITFHRRDKSDNVTDKRIKKLEEIRARLEEPWYKTFYERFYAHFGGMASARLMWTRSDLDEMILDRQRELNTSLDLMACIIRRLFPELWALKMSNKNLLPWLVRYAADRARLDKAFSHYHWLVDQLRQITQMIFTASALF